MTVPAQGAAPTEPAEAPAEEVAPPEHPLLVALRDEMTGFAGGRVEDERGMTALYLDDPNQIHEVCVFLRKHPAYEMEMLLDICGIDYWDDEPRFGLVYNLHSVTTNQRLLVKIRLRSGDPTAPTLTDIWSGANWLEREVFDLFGIRFTGHPDLRKILTPDDLEGHPLRKDFPLGNVDIWPEGADTNVAR